MFDGICVPNNIFAAPVHLDEINLTTKTLLAIEDGRQD